MQYPKTKITLAALLLCVTVIQINAQQSRPIQITPQAGAALAFLNKDIYSGKPLNISPQFGLELKKTINNKVAISVETQYNNFNIATNVTQTYQRFITGSSVKNFNASTAVNNILNVQYTIKTKNGETNVAFGAGAQYLKLGENNLQISNPFQLGQLVSVFRETAGNYTNPILQFNLGYTWYVKPCLGINLGIKAQYIKLNYQTIYKPLPADTNNLIATERLLNNGDVISTQPQLNLMPYIGVRFVLGGCKSPIPNRSNYATSCFNLTWQNQPQPDSCFKEDKLQFLLAQKNINPTIQGYDVYLAPLNDLNNQQLLVTLPYPSNSFSINAALLDAGKQYAVIVKMKNVKQEDECLLYIQPVKRCADCCKDVNLPN